VPSIGSIPKISCMFMYVCIYIYMYVLRMYYVRMYVCICMYVCMYVRMYVHLYSKGNECIYLELTIHVKLH